MGADFEKAAASAAEVRDGCAIEIPGQTVDRIYTPSSIESLTELVRAAAADDVGLLVIGGQTRLHWAKPTTRVDCAVSLAGLSGIDEFEPDEGVLHAAAGTPLRVLREAVAAEGWELPLDAAGENATVGGVIASAASGPRGQLFGPVKDAILGLEVVGGDGVATKCGGRVVKNVTGYDMAKLYCGSFGSLAIVTGAWLRLRPAPSVRRTLRAEGVAVGETFEAIRKGARPIEARGLCWEERAGATHAEVVVELGGSAEGVSHDAERLHEVLSFEEVSDDRVDAIREQRAARDHEVMIRARVLGSRLGEMRNAVIDAGLSVSIDLGMGSVYGFGMLSDSTALLGLRARAESCGGYAVFESLPDDWRQDVDVFGAHDGTESIIETLTARFDPAGILNPGRFVTQSRRDETRE